MEIKNYLKKAKYDSFGQMIWNVDKNNQNLILDIRGWGHIQNLFKTQEEAANFQDKVGQWITDAINEKLERENVARK